MHPDNHPLSARGPLTNDHLAEDIAQATIEEYGEPDIGLAAPDLWLNRTVEAFGVTILVAMTGLILGNACSRYLFGQTYIWVDELVISLVPWLTMSGLFLSVRRREIIRIDFFLDRCPPAMRRVSKLLADFVSVVVFGYLAIASFQLISMFGADRSVYLKLEAGWFTSAMVIGSLLVVLAFMLDAFTSFRRRPA